MDKWCSNRLTVIGPKGDVRRFLQSRWEQRLHGRHSELMENSPRRFVCLFESDEPPLDCLRRLSRCWPQLVFLLDWEVDSERLKGLAKSNAGRVEHWETTY